MKQYLGLLKDVFDNGVEKEDRTGTGTLSVTGRMLRFDMSEGFPLLTTKSVHFHSVKAELLWFISGNTNVKWLQENGCRIWDAWAVKEDKFWEYPADLNSRYLKAHDYRVVDSDNKDPNDWGVEVVFKGNKEHYESLATDEEKHAYLTELGVDVNTRMYEALEGDLGPVYGKQWRNFEGHDQLANAIKLIKEDPDSRRIIVNSWNVAELEEMSLPPCHLMYQFTVTNGKLNLMWTQRQ